MSDYWREYDEELQNRTAQLDEELSAEFERIMMSRGKKLTKIIQEAERGRFLNELLFHTSLSFIPERIRQFKQKTGEADSLLKEIIGETKKTIYSRHCRNSLVKLVQEARYLPNTDQEKKEVYLLFLDQVQFVHQNTDLFDKEQATTSFLRTLSLPATEEEKVKYEKIIRKMQKEGYLSQGTSKRLDHYFFSGKNIPELKKVTPFPNRDNQAQTTAPAYQEGGLEPAKGNDNEEILEYLVTLFNLSQEKARMYTPKITLEQLNDLHDKIEARVGQDYAVTLIQINPEILSYLERGQLALYLKLLKQVQQRIREIPETEDELQIKFGVENNLRAYANLEELTELKERLYGETAKADYKKMDDKEEISVDSSGFNLAEYTFLHRKDKVVASRLDALIAKGSVTVTGHEHWTEKDSGARSLHILKKITFQMKSVYAVLGMPEPNCFINHGTRTLSIDEESRLRLEEIREQAYALQRETER